MAESDITPRMITARDGDGHDVSVNVSRMCAEDENFLDLMTMALERFLQSGVTDFPVGMSITIFDREGNTGAAATVNWNKDIDLEHYSPEEDAIIKRRTADPS